MSWPFAIQVLKLPGKCKDHMNVFSSEVNKLPVCASPNKLGVDFVTKMLRKCLFQFQRNSFALLIFLNIDQNLVFIEKTTWQKSQLLQMCLMYTCMAAQQFWQHQFTRFLWQDFNNSKLTWKMKVLCSCWTFWERVKWSHPPAVAKQVKVIFPVVLLSCRGQELCVCL